MFQKTKQMQAIKGLVNRLGDPAKYRNLQHRLDLQRGSFLFAYYNQFHKEALKLNNQLKSQQSQKISTNNSKQGSSTTTFDSTKTINFDHNLQSSLSKSNNDQTTSFDENYDADSVLKQLSTLPIHEQRNFVQESLTQQIIRNLLFWKENDLLKSPFPPKPTEKILEMLIEQSKSIVSNLNSDSDQQKQQKEMNDLFLSAFVPGSIIPFPDGFELQIRKSQIDHPKSGYGVFVKGHILPGTVVAIYPGNVYFPRSLTREIALNNEYMISRYDAIAVDGRFWGHKAINKMVASAALGHSLEKDKSLDPYRNPLGIGHYINHPGKEQLPNVLQTAYEFMGEGRNEFPKELRSFIPNIPASDSFVYGDKDVLVNSVVLITTRHIKDEELFLNYRYNPRNPYPDWYNQPFPDEAERRWAKPRLFWPI